jgi:septal ring factor EnvC (AmiA/AmiB activator)
MQQQTPKSLPKFYVVLFAAFVGMGMSMPGCPGQEAMQQQIDTLTTQNTELTKRLQAMDTQLKAVDKDMIDVKTLLKPMADAVQAQKTALDQLDANLKEVQSKLASKGGAKPAGKPVARKRL